MFNLIGDSEIAIKKANKRKLHELLDKYGNVEEIEKSGNLQDAYAFDFAKINGTLDEVLEERQLENYILNNKDSISSNNSSIDTLSKIKELKTMLTNLGYFQGEIDNNLSPSFYKALNDYSEDDNLNNENIVNRINHAYNKLINYDNLSRVDFDGQYLRFIENGHTILELPAMSGKSEYQEKKYQNLINKGQIPEGSYRIKQNNVQDIDKVSNLLGYTGRGMAPGGWNSWGLKRVWLEPFNTNSMYNRNKFSIHGGANLGSSGCIDLAKHELEFFNKLKKYGRDMIINVKYPKEKLR